MPHNHPADSFGKLSRTLRDHVRTAAELRIANRLLLNEIHIAMEALRQKLSAMCPRSSFDERDLREEGQSCFSSLPS
jgi:hypothetical protein